MIRRTFVTGKMNKDVDERLLPDGEYSHAENIRVANSEGSDIGAIENVLGTEQLTNIDVEDSKTIGAYSDNSNQKIYFFNTSKSQDSVYEYDYSNRVLTPLLVDTRGLLNFSEDFLITGIVKIFNEDFKKDLLIWTDDRNLPRAINIERSKSYLPDGFNEEQITLSKAPPLQSPSYEFTFDSRSSQNSFADKFLAFATRFKYRDGGLSALSPFSYYAFSPTELDLDFDTLENRGMSNNFNALDISFDTGTSEVVEIELVFKESNSNNIYSIESFNKEEITIPDNQTFNYRFINDKTYSPLAEDELFRLFDNVPNKAKALEFIGNRLVFGNYEEGFDIVDETGKSIQINYTVSVDSQSVEDSLVSSFINVDKRSISINLSNEPLTIGTRISFNLDLSEVNQDNEEQLSSRYVDDLDYIVNDNFNDFTELVRSESFRMFIEGALTNSFNTNAQTTPPLNVIEIASTQGFTYLETSTGIDVFPPSINYIIDATPGDINDNNDPEARDSIVYNWLFKDQTEINKNSAGVLTSVKSIRSYELGLVYVFPYGKISTVLTSMTNTVNVNSINAINKNQFRVILNNKPPKDAIAYRFAVKQTRSNYENLFAITFFNEGQFIWVKLEGSDKDKVSVGDILYVKSDTNGILNNAPEVTVLELSTKDRNFIEGNGFNPQTGEIIEGVPSENDGAIIEPSGVYMKIKAVGFNMSYNAFNFLSLEESNASSSGRPFRDVDPVRAESPFPISKNARIKMSITAYVERRDERLSYTATYVANEDYDSFYEFYKSEVGFRDVPIPQSDRVFSILDNDSDKVRILSPLNGDGKRRTSFLIVNISIRNSNNIVVFETKPSNNNDALFYETAETFPIINGNHQGNVSNQLNGSPAVSVLNWYNTFVLGEGVESISYLDGFNQNSLNIDLRPNTVSLQRFSKVRRFADLTYSEPYNENTNINGLSEFNLARANFKDDIDKNYGLIQKLHARDTDLVVFQEDKVHRVLFGKDLLFNSDGTSNVTSIDEVLGQHIGYLGEFGISRNPESFSFDANNLYFTDTKRGSVLRLGNNGITEISDYGMRRYFKNEFRESLNNKKIGAFDPFHDQYVLNISNETLSVPTTISCGQVFRQSNFSGTLTHTLDLGVQQGETGVTFVTNGVPLKVAVNYNGQTYTSGIISDTETHSITFNKQSSIPSTATLVIESLDCNASIEITNNCINAPEISVISIVLNDDNDEGLERINRYKWVNEDFDSRYKTFNSVFEGDSDITVDGLTGRVDVFDVNTGEQGVNSLPIPGSSILIESIKSPNNPASFIDGNRIGYLVSDVEYTESQLQEIIDNATFPEPTLGIEVNGDPTLNTSFNVPTTNNRYVYLIWDYINSTQPPCNSGMDVVFIFDYTSSMGSQIEEAKAGVSNIIDTIKLQSAPNDYRLGLVLADEINSSVSRYSTNQIYIDLPDSQKIVNEGANGRRQWITSIVPLEINNETNFEQQLNIINNPTDGLSIGSGANSPEPLDFALSKVVEENFSNPLRPNVARYVIMITDAAPSGEDDAFTADDINEVARLRDICIQNNIKVIVLGTGVGQQFNNVFPWRDLAEGTGGSWNSSFNAEVVQNEIINGCAI